MTGSAAKFQNACEDTGWRGRNEKTVTANHDSVRLAFDPAPDRPQVISKRGSVLPKQMTYQPLILSPLL